MAFIAGHLVNAGPSPIAWIWSAIVNVRLAAHSLESLRTFAAISSWLVHAGSLVLARIRFTLVDVRFAEVSFIPRITIATKSTLFINAITINTRVTITFVHLAATIVACEPLGACALEISDKISTCAPVLAGIGVTLVNLALTCWASVTLRTHA